MSDRLRQRKFSMWVLPWVLMIAGQLCGFRGLAVVHAATDEPTPDSPQKIVFLGDSLTEGYGVPKDKAFPALVEAQLKIDGYTDVEVINAGISGSTTASGESRLRWFLKRNPTILFLALGGNDGLRGLSLSETKKNLERVILLAQKNRLQVLFAGMQMPPNYGKKYTDDYRKLFFDLAKTYHLAMVPFLLEGVAGDPQLNQGDGIHPNEKGHRKVAALVIPELEKMLTLKNNQGHNQGHRKLGSSIK